MASKIVGHFLWCALLLSANVSAQQGDCAGCNLFMVSYDSGGFWLGHQAVPGVTISMTIGPNSGTNNGICTGIEPDCQGAPCKFGKVKIRIDNVSAGGTIGVENPPGGPSTDLDEGDGAAFTAESQTPAGNENIACGAQPLTILSIKHPNGNGYAVALLCTNCPGTDPY